MQHARCSACGNELPLSDTFTLQGEIVCEPCCERLVAERADSMKPGDLIRNADHTICGWCRLDSGEQQLRLLGGIPSCEPCETRMRNWPYPRWIKVSFAALLLLALGSFLY